MVQARMHLPARRLRHRDELRFKKLAPLGAAQQNDVIRRRNRSALRHRSNDLEKLIGAWHLDDAGNGDAHRRVAQPFDRHLVARRGMEICGRLLGKQWPIEGTGKQSRLPREQEAVAGIEPNCDAGAGCLRRPPCVGGQTLDVGIVDGLKFHARVSLGHRRNGGSGIRCAYQLHLPVRRHH